MGEIKQKPTLYVIAGCNGAGKTTFAKIFLPEEVSLTSNIDSVRQLLIP